MKRGGSRQGGPPKKKDLPESLLKRPIPGQKREESSGKTLSEERYKAFIESIDDGVYEVDIEGNFVYFNNALCKVFGYPREEIQWQNFSKFMDEEHARAAYEIFNDIFRSGKGISDLTWNIVDKERQPRIIDLSANLITNKEGKKVRMAVKTGTVFD